MAARSGGQPSARWDAAQAASLMSASHWLSSLSSHDLHNSGLSLIPLELAEILLFHTVFFLLLSVILSGRVGIGSLDTAWLERQSAADGGTKAVKQFSFISSQVQLLALPDC